MRELLEFILKGILGKEKFEIEETEEESRQTNFSIKVPENFTGIVIGKGGKTIKAIRSVLKVRATLEGRGVYLNVG